MSNAHSLEAIAELEFARRAGLSSALLNRAHNELSRANPIAAREAIRSAISQYIRQGELLMGLSKRIKAKLEP